MTRSQAPEEAANVDPVYEWLHDGASYLLRLDLPEFKKDNIQVHVDGEGRLTVLGQRKPSPGAGEGKALRLHKVFQLPNTANLGAITGRFDGVVLTLTVPKLQKQPTGAAVAPPPPPPTQAKEEAQVADDKPADQEDKAAKVGREVETEERRIEEESASLTARGKEEDEKPKPVAPPPQPSEKTRGDHREDQDEKARAHHRGKVSCEAVRRIEAAQARVAEAKAKAERERKLEHWKERAAAEGLKWAEMVSKKKEVIATAVAAFTLGVLVSHRLFSRN